MGQHHFSLERPHSCLLSPKIPILPCCPVRSSPMAHGIALPKHRDLVFLVTPSQTHTGNPSQQINSGCCNTAAPATPKSPEEQQDGKQEGISTEKQVQRESPKVTNATGWHLLSLDCTIHGFHQSSSTPSSELYNPTSTESRGTAQHLKSIA